LRYNQLGNTGLKVPEICLGVLPMGPRQKNLDLKQCTAIILKSFENGINFLDTAQAYDTYDPIREALKQVNKKDIIVSTKSKDSTYEEMEKAIHEARKQMGLEHIPLFHLHGFRSSVEIFEERAGALQCLLDYKEKGVIGYVGIATHSAAVVRKGAQIPEIDVIFPLLNVAGLGIIDGNVQDMINAISEATKAGKGIYLMKALGGGNLLGRYHEALSFARNIPGVASIAIGMISEEEVEYNVGYFNGEDPAKLPEIQINQKRLIIDLHSCLGCGSCSNVCPNNAMSLVNGKAHVEVTKCLLCGYCTEVCSEFAIKVV
jgi:aryl-alcohol dehydrogenase-like predicted oxidoreductase